MSKDLPLSPEDVTEIVSILDGSAYQTLDIKTSRFRLRVARDGDGWTQEWNYADDAATAPPVVAAHPRDEADGKTIQAPLPGTFYRSPSPGAPPFVEIGSDVERDTVVGIIETMKLMNPVHAGTSGTISEILADNAQMVTKHATLMRLA